MLSFNVHFSSLFLRILNYSGVDAGVRSVMESIYNFPSRIDDIDGHQVHCRKKHGSRVINDYSVINNPLNDSESFWNHSRLILSMFTIFSIMYYKSCKNIVKKYLPPDAINNV